QGVPYPAIDRVRTEPQGEKLGARDVSVLLAGERHHLVGGLPRYSRRVPDGPRRGGQTAHSFDILRRWPSPTATPGRPVDRARSARWSASLQTSRSSRRPSTTTTRTPSRSRSSNR